jgi:hypothetical protein
MIDKNSPYYEHDASSAGWLHRRARNGAEILNSDLVRIINANPELIPDAVCRELVKKGLQNQLKARRGRKRAQLRDLKELYIITRYDELLAELQKEAGDRAGRGHKKSRGDLAPAEKACAVIGDEMGMEWESVRNLVSSLNIARNRMSDSTTKG